MQIEHDGHVYDVKGQPGGPIDVMDVKKGIGWGYSGNGSEPGYAWARELALIAKEKVEDGH